MNEITYDPNEKIDKWAFEESELRKAFRERKEFKEKCENLQSKIDKANELLDKLEMQPAYLDCKYYELGGFDELRNVLKEDK